MHLIVVSCFTLATLLLQERHRRASTQPLPAVRSIRPAAVIRGAHQSGVNALAVAAVGAGRVLVVSGGDDQALHAALLAFEFHPDTAPAAMLPSEAAHGGAANSCLPGNILPQLEKVEHSGGVSTSNRTAATGSAVVRNGCATGQGGTLAMNGHASEAAAGMAAVADSAQPDGAAAPDGLRGYAAAVAAQSSEAALECLATAVGPNAAADGIAGGAARRAVGVRLLGSCRVANAHSSALRGAWTDGRRAVTVGLDQRVRVWGIALSDVGSPPVEPGATAEDASLNHGSRLTAEPAVDSAASRLHRGHDSGDDAMCSCDKFGSIAHSDDLKLELQEEACVFTQVLEPEDMAVIVAPRPSAGLRDAGGERQGVLTIAVAGRGTEVLRYDPEQRAFLT